MKKLIIFLLFPVILCAQDPFTKNIDQRFSQYYRTQVPLKVHLTLNQGNYFTGDTIFYKAHLLFAQNLQPVKLNTILHVLLKDVRGTIVIKQMIRIKNGYGGNQIVIPDGLPPDSYHLVAYSDWMESFGEEFYFQKWISIGDSPFTEKKDHRDSLVVFVEGGKFVETLNHKVVIQGRPLSNGSIIDDNGEAVGRFSLDKFGLGFVYLTPNDGRQYFAKYEDGQDRFNLPSAEKDGLVLLATMQRNSLRVIVQAPESSLLKHEKIYLVVASRGGILYAANFQISDNPYMTITVPLDNAIPGIAQLSLLNERENILAERLVFVPPLVTVNFETKTNKRKYHTREKVDVNFKLNSISGVSEGTSISATVVSKTLDVMDDKSIVNNLLFYSDLSSTSSIPYSFFNDSASYLTIDNYAIIQTGKQLQKPYNSTNGSQKYIQDRIRISGKAMSISNVPVPDSAKITFLLQKTVSVYETYIVNNSFKVSFLSDFYGDEDVYYAVEYKGKKLEDVRLTIDDKCRPLQLNTFERRSGLKSFDSQRRMINEAYSFFNKAIDYNARPKPNDYFEEEIFGADVEIKLSDYILFPTMEETLREIIPLVQHRRIKEKSVVRVFIDEIDRFAEGSPLFVIDGVITNDQNYFLSLKPSDVSTIKVVHSLDKLNVFGALGKGGIILVETNIPDNWLNVPVAENTFRVSGLSEPLKFKARSPMNKRVPDLRTALYWNPGVAIRNDGSANFSFITSDVPGDYVIRIEGITAEGEPFTSETEFTVEFEPAASR